MKTRGGKYFTLMLIPDSTARVRRIRISRWVFCIVLIPLLCIAVTAALLNVQVRSLQSRLQYSSARLSETVDLNRGLEEAIAYIENSRETSVQEREYFRARLYEAQQQVERLLEQTEAVDDITQSILGVFAELYELGLPFSFDELLLQAVAVGGTYYNTAEYTLVAMDEYAERLRSFFRYRPVGWPVELRHISSGFGYRPNPFTGQGRERHQGIDIRAPTGTEVFATAYGVVRTAGWNENGYGLFVIIEHGYGYSTVFAHNSVLMVSAGDAVERGQLIALSGNTGRSTGPHVHFEVRHNNIPRDPVRYLN